LVVVELETMVRAETEEVVAEVVERWHMLAIYL
jgi:hypothetical protein